MSNAPGRLQVWFDGGAWRWLYRDAAGGRVLLGNRSHPSRSAATRAARVAYPQVPLERRRRSRALTLRLLLGAALGGLGVGATLAARRAAGRRA
jgi:hypothetical protein